MHMDLASSGLFIFRASIGPLIELAIEIDPRGLFLQTLTRTESLIIEPFSGNCGKGLHFFDI
ncbi:hypothetical protein CsSME_00003960 [Camellia sinensis var. sinensis]